MKKKRADTLSKSVITEKIFDEIVQIPFPISLITRYIGNKVKQDWQLYWTNSEKDRDTHGILNKVNVDFICTREVLAYYILVHGSFPSFLFKIGKRENDKCGCGSRGSGLLFVIGRCPMMVNHFIFKRSQTLRENLQRIIFLPGNYRLLADNYKILNSKYSFMRYKL